MFGPSLLLGVFFFFYLLLFWFLDLIRLEKKNPAKHKYNITIIIQLYKIYGV